MNGKTLYQQSQLSKANRDYANNPYKTKKEFDNVLDTLSNDHKVKREYRRKFRMCNKPKRTAPRRYYDRKSTNYYYYMKNGAKNGNDCFEITICNTIIKPEFEIKTEHKNYAKSSRYWKGYDYLTYVLYLPVGWTIKPIDELLTIYQHNKIRKIGEYQTVAGYILTNKGLTKTVLTQNDKYNYHAKTLKSGIKGIQKKYKKDNPIVTKDTVLTKNKYHILTGACIDGITAWLDGHNINVTSMKVEDLLKIEEDFYGKKKLLSLLS